jgi:hypothetical protein
MGTNPKVCFLGGMGKGSLFVFKVGRWDFFNFSRNVFFGGVGWDGWKKGVGIYIYIIYYYYFRFFVL